jgi:hypothetical protein
MQAFTAFFAGGIYHREWRPLGCPDAGFVYFNSAFVIKHETSESVSEIGSFKTGNQLYSRSADSGSKIGSISWQSLRIPGNRAGQTTINRFSS